MILFPVQMNQFQMIPMKTEFQEVNYRGNRSYINPDVFHNSMDHIKSSSVPDGIDGIKFMLYQWRKIAPLKTAKVVGLGTVSKQATKEAFQKVPDTLLTVEEAMCAQTSSVKI